MLSGLGLAERKAYLARNSADKANGFGLGRDGKKRVLTCLTNFGRENLEDWKAVLRGLVERGLRGVLLVVQDDFSGLLPISRSLFPGADVQLCLVHMQRNAKSQLSKADAAEFQQRWRTVKAAWNVDVGAHQFEELCDRFATSNPAFIGELRKKREHYLAFLKYPEPIRRSLSSTRISPDTARRTTSWIFIARSHASAEYPIRSPQELQLGASQPTPECGQFTCSSERPNHLLPTTGWRPA